MEVECQFSQSARGRGGPSSKASTFRISPTLKRPIARLPATWECSNEAYLPWYKYKFSGEGEGGKSGSEEAKDAER